ncbi:MAG: polysaccharide biosynthesis protein, partial [Pseudomonadota bacterium]
CKYEIGLIRNHYVGRTFISPGQSSREMKVRRKFNTVEGVLKDRVVVMVDDSIVRGTTAQQLVRMVREAGAREVHFRVASPPVKWPCFYGMDYLELLEEVANRGALKIVEGDVRHIEEVEPHLRGATAVLHLADLDGIDLVQAEPEEALQTNVLATAALVQAASYLRVRWRVL